MTPSSEWGLASELSEKILAIAKQRGVSPNAVLDDAVRHYLRDVSTEAEVSDPLVGMYSGSSNIATEAEVLIDQAANRQSGWTWKKSHR